MKSKSLVETSFAELPDGTLLDTIEDPNNATSTLFAIYRDNRVAYVEGHETDDRILVPISRSTELLRNVRFSRGAKSYDSATGLLDQLCRLFSWCLDMPEEHQKVLCCFVMSTWMIEKLPVAPYVAFVGLPHSGKTTALSLLNLLCRHSLLTSDITSASFCDVCNLVTPTVLIDETATAGDRRALFHLLRAGSTKGAVAVRKNKSFNAYGPKAFCWTQLPNDAALNSRCIIIPLQDTDRKGLIRPMDPIVQAQAEDVVQMLQQYRFENLNRLSLATVSGDESLHSRSRDLYQALALPIADGQAHEFLAKYFKSQENFQRESLSPLQVAVLRALDSYIHENIAASSCAQIGLTDEANLRLMCERESLHASPHQVGDVLTPFGLTDRKRTNAGYDLILSRDTRVHIHRLVRLYGIEPENSVNRESCYFCARHKSPQVGASDSVPAAQRTPLPEGPEGERSELGELRALKKG